MDEEGRYLEALTSKILEQAITVFENKYFPYFNRILKGNTDIALPPFTGYLRNSI